MSNKKLNLLKEPIHILILKIGTPIMIGFLFNILFNVVDTYFASNISIEALTALSVTFPIFLIIIAISQGIYGGALTLISNSIGEKNYNKTNLYQTQAISFGFIISITTMIIFLFTIDYILSFLNISEQSLNLSKIYIFSISPLFVTMTLFNVFNCGFIARGKSKPFRNILIIGFFLNIILNQLLIYGITLNEITIIPKFGFLGIGLATSLINFLGLIYIFYLGKNLFIKDILLKNLIPQKKYFKELLKYSIPPFINILSVAIGIFILTYYLAEFGSEVFLSGYNIAIRIEQLSLVTSIGLSMSIGTIVGNNNGAKNFKRIKETLKISIIISFLFLIFIMLPIYFYKEFIFKIFTDNLKILEFASLYLTFAAILFIFYLIMSNCVSICQAIKKPYLISNLMIVRQVILPLITFPLFIFLFENKILGLLAALSFNVISITIIVFFLTLYYLKKLK